MIHVHTSFFLLINRTTSIVFDALKKSVRGKKMKTKLNIKKIALAILSIGAIGALATMPFVSAFQGNPDVQGPNYDADLHALKTDAFDSADFATWKDLMETSGSQGRVLDVVNEDNFDIFVQAHNAALAGDMDTSKELRSQLGLNNGNGPRDGTGYGKMNGGSGKRLGQGHARGNGQGLSSGQQPRDGSSLGLGNGQMNGDCLLG